MADLLPLIDFLDEYFDRSKRVVLPRVNPFDNNYEENKFRALFRLSKRIALDLLSELSNIVVDHH